MSNRGCAVWKRRKDIRGNCLNLDDLTYLRYGYTNERKEIEKKKYNENPSHNEIYNFFPSRLIFIEVINIRVFNAFFVVYFCLCCNNLYSHISSFGLASAVEIAIFHNTHTHTIREFVQCSAFATTVSVSLWVCI